MTRVFVRAQDTPEAAIDEAMAAGAAGPPRLHSCPSAAVVGAVEITDTDRVIALYAAYAADLLKDARDLEDRAERWRP